MPNFWGSFAQSFNPALAQGAQLGQRQQQINLQQQQAENQKKEAALKGLDYIQKISQMPEEVQGPAFKAYSNWFKGVSGQEVDPNVLAAFKSMARTDAEAAGRLIPGVKRQLDSGQLKVDDLMRMMSKGGMDSLVKIGSMWQADQANNEYQKAMEGPQTAQAPSAPAPVAIPPGGPPLLTPEEARQLARETQGAPLPPDEERAAAFGAGGVTPSVSQRPMGGVDPGIGNLETGIPPASEFLYGTKGPTPATQATDTTSYATQHVMADKEFAYWDKAVKNFSTVPGARPGQMAVLKLQLDKATVRASTTYFMSRTAELMQQKPDQPLRMAQQKALTEAVSKYSVEPPGVASLMAPASDKQYAPTQLAFRTVQAASILGKPYRIGETPDPAVAELALQMQDARDQMMVQPKGVEGNFAFNARALAKANGASPEEQQRVFMRAANWARYSLAQMGAGGAKMGVYGVEAGEFQPPGAPGLPPGTPGGTGQPGAPTTGVPFGGEEGKTPLQKRQEAVSVGGAAGEVAKTVAMFSIVDNYVTQIDRLSAPLITAKKAPESWFQGAKLGGGRITNYDQLAKYYNTQVEAFLGQMARTVGAQVGVLTQLDVDSMRNLLPTIGDTMAQRDAKIGSLKAILTINKEAHKARLTSGGELPQAAYDRYRDAIDQQIAKVEQAAGIRTPKTPSSRVGAEPPFTIDLRGK